MLIKVGKLLIFEFVLIMLNFYGYGESWFFFDYCGYCLVWYIGGWFGFVLCVMLVLEEYLGVVVFINVEFGVVFNVVIYCVFDVYLYLG